MQRRHFAILPILLALGFILIKNLTAPKFTNPETGSKNPIGLSLQEEETLGLQSYQQVLQQEGGNWIKSGPEVELVTRVARRLASAAAEKSDAQFQWQVSVIRSNEVNAFCLPGGKIVVYTGILPVAKNEAGLATVLGHEMAHATGHHGSQRVYKQQVEQILMMGAQGSIGNMDPSQQQTIMGFFGAGARYGHALPFNRKQESEADHVGLLYMGRAGYDPKESVEFWQRMEQAVGRGQPSEFTSDHPSNGTRIQQLQGWMPEAEKEYANSKMRQIQAPTQDTKM